MKQETKIKLAELIIQFLEAQQEDKVNIPVMVGTLKRKWGLVGMKNAEIGDPVYEYEGKYLIYLETLDEKRSVEIPFTKETLASQIEFTNAKTEI